MKRKVFKETLTKSSAEVAPSVSQANCSKNLQDM